MDGALGGIVEFAMKLLCVIDCQNDFISQALGTPEAQAIIPNIKSKLSQLAAENIIFTQDTHFDSYLTTMEGKNLPVKHCIKGSDGWKVCDALERKDALHVEKYSFGTLHLPEVIVARYHLEDLTEIELVGLCTGICVLSNAVILKAAFPEKRIVVDASCCACVSPESHQRALEAMKLCQIEVRNESSCV